MSLSCNVAQMTHLARSNATTTRVTVADLQQVEVLGITAPCGGGPDIENLAPDLTYRFRP